MKTEMKTKKKLKKRDQEFGKGDLFILGNGVVEKGLRTIIIQTKKKCYIKGNISSKGQKIYHIPGNLNYEKTKINENKGERWFCSEEEAKMNGWRKSKK